MEDNRDPKMVHLIIFAGNRAIHVMVNLELQPKVRFHLKDQESAFTFAELFSSDPNYAWICHIEDPSDKLLLSLGVQYED